MRSIGYTHSYPYIISTFLYYKYFWSYGPKCHKGNFPKWPNFHTFFFTLHLFVKTLIFFCEIKVLPSNCDSYIHSWWFFSWFLNEIDNFEVNFSLVTTSLKGPRLWDISTSKCTNDSKNALKSQKIIKIFYIEVQELLFTTYWCNICSKGWNWVVISTPEILSLIFFYPVSTIFNFL